MAGDGGTNRCAVVLYDGADAEGLLADVRVAERRATDDGPRPAVLIGVWGALVAATALACVALRDTTNPALVVLMSLGWPIAFTGCMLLLMAVNGVVLRHRRHGRRAASWLGPSEGGLLEPPATTPPKKVMGRDSQQWRFVAIVATLTISLALIAFDGLRPFVGQALLFAGMFTFFLTVQEMTRGGPRALASAAITTDADALHIRLTVRGGRTDTSVAFGDLATVELARARAGGSVCRLTAGDGRTALFRIVESPASVLPMFEGSSPRPPERPMSGSRS